MRSSGRNVRGALAALALFLAVGIASARGADLPEQVRALFESGRTNTPSAVSAAKARYGKLKAAYASDPRIDYAYGVVLINQRKYREASEVFARYLASDEPELAAYCLHVSVLLPLNKYGKSLEQAGVLARRLSVDAGGSTEDDQQDAAAFLGTVFRYLELPRKGSVDSRLLTRSKQEVLALLDEHSQVAFEKGYNAVAKRLSELQAEHELHEEKKIDKITNQKERERLAIENAKTAGSAAEEKAQFTQEQLREVQRQYTELQKQMSPFVTQRSVLESAMVFRRSQIERNDRSRNANPDASRALRNEIKLLEQQASELNRRLRPLQASAAALEAKAAQHQFSLASAENESRKSERLGVQANRRIDRAEDKLAKRSTASDGKLTSFATYAGFSYELERNRVLDWVSK